MEVVLAICKQFQNMVLSLLFVKMKNSDHKITDNLIIKREIFVVKTDL